MLSSLTQGKLCAHCVLSRLMALGSCMQKQKQQQLWKQFLVDSGAEISFGLIGWFESLQSLQIYVFHEKLLYFWWKFSSNKLKLPKTSWVTTVLKLYKVSNVSKVFKVSKFLKSTLDSTRILSTLKINLHVIDCNISHISLVILFIFARKSCQIMIFFKSYCNEVQKV